jgi:hypothetical protein
MNPVLRTALVCLVLASSGCATQRGMMAGTRMNLAKYEHSKVGILPISINPNYDSQGLPLEEIRTAVKAELEDNTELHPRLMTSAELPGGTADFPLTPSRLRVAVGSASAGDLAPSEAKPVVDLDAVIGISIAAWGPPTPGHRARINLVIAFVDLKDPTRKWVMTSVFKAHSLEEIPRVLHQDLGLQLVDLRYWLKSGLVPWTSEHGSPEDPILTFYSPTLPTPKSDVPVSSKTLDLVITGIDDAGLTEVEVSNPAAHFEWHPRWTGTASGPIYVSTPLTIPLAFGSNRITIAAQNAAGRRLERNIGLQSTARRGVVLFGVSVERYSGLANAVGAAEAARRVEKSGEDYFYDRPFTLTNEGANVERIADSMHAIRATLGFGDELLILLVGRGGVGQQNTPYLALPADAAVSESTTNFETKASPSIQLSDVTGLTMGQPSLIVMDLCTDAAFLEDSRLSLGRAIDAFQQSPFAKTIRLAAQMSDCHDGVGKIADAVSAWLRDKHPARGGAAQLEPLYAALTTGRPDLLASPQAPPAWKLSPTGALSYWAVASSTTSQTEAIERSKQLKSLGYSSQVVLGIDGVFGVTLGQSDTPESAGVILRKARADGHASAESYVLDPEKVKSTIWH